MRRFLTAFCPSMIAACKNGDDDGVECLDSGPSKYAHCENPPSREFDDACLEYPKGCKVSINENLHVCQC